jgi:hypothetical protein
LGRKERRFGKRGIGHACISPVFSFVGSQTAYQRFFMHFEGVRNVCEFAQKTPIFLIESNQNTKKTAPLKKNRVFP